MLFFSYRDPTDKPATSSSWNQFIPDASAKLIIIHLVAVGSSSTPPATAVTAPPEALTPSLLPSLSIGAAPSSEAEEPEDGMARRAAAATGARLLRRLGPLAADPPMRGD